MSRVRGLDHSALPPYERGRCRWCAGPVAPPRRTFCSDACVAEWKLRSHPNFRRQKVFERDRGVCASCGLDCRALADRLVSLLYSDPSKLDAELARLGMTRRSMGPFDHRVPVDLRGKVGRRVVEGPRVWEPGRSLWEVDHVLAVAEGGGSCSLSNLQTLCLWCHREKTAEMRRRRAAGPTEPPDEMFADPDAPPPSMFELEEAEPGFRAGDEGG